jgi:acyl dehydratase
MALFTSVSGNFAPIHSDLEHAAQSHFGGRVAPASMLAAVAMGLASMDTPAAASAGMVGMSWRFTKPVRPGDTIHVRWVLARKRLTDNSRWGLGVWTADVINQRGEVCCSGEVSRLVARREAIAVVAAEAEASASAAAPAPARRRRRRRSTATAAEAAAEAVADAPVPEPAPQDLPVVDPGSPAPPPAGRRRRRRRTPSSETPSPEVAPATSAAAPTRPLTPVRAPTRTPATPGEAPTTPAPRRRRRRRSGGGGNGGSVGNQPPNGGGQGDSTWGSTPAPAPAEPSSTISRVFKRLRGR